MNRKLIPLEDLVGTVDEIVDDTETIIARMAVTGALKALPLHERAIIRLYFGLDNYAKTNIGEIAQQLNTTPDQVEAGLQSALQALRKELDG